MNNFYSRPLRPAYFAGSLFALTAILSACSSSDKETPQTSSSATTSSSTAMIDNGFEASISDFIDYPAWAVADYAIGNSNLGLKGAHQGDDDNYTRKTFMNTTAANSSGEFAQGSIIVKETFTYTMTSNGWEKSLAVDGGLLGMVKRGGDFNSDHGGWEWFMLAGDLSSVVAQGSDLMNGACNACHSVAEQQGGMDYSFPKPTEYIATDALFANYQSWDMIEFTAEPHAKLGGAHLNSDTPPLRRIFQKQLLANPTDAGDMGYPIGTVLVKDVSVDNNIEQVVAMVKRGGDFNPDNGGWEWFMLDPNDYSILMDDQNMPVRGADLLGGACNSCHGLATDDLGADYVFKHQHAPFNTDTTGQYVANKASFMGYTNWTLTDYALGVSNPFIGGAHQGSNSEFARAVFQNEKAGMLSGDEYPMGTVIIKETFTTNDGDKVFAEMGGVLAMVKRGGEYNPDHNGWEWLMLSPTGDIAARSATLMNGNCNACHSKGAGDFGIDYTFNKPSEYVATIADFDDYKNWTQIGTNTGNNPANGGAHDVNSVRKTYKKQATASPYFEADGYPIGTTILKELTVDDQVTQLYGMVKRGGDFNSANGNWEWFLLANDGSAITTRGADVGGGICNVCHGKAGLMGDDVDASFMGKDYVFYHDDDPVPMPISAMAM